MPISKTKAIGSAAGGALMLAIGIVSVFEGTVKHTYIDPAGVPTICTGHTGSDVKPGMGASDEMCRDFLATDIAWAFAVEDRALAHPENVPAPTRAAMASFIYNLGASAWLSSPMPDLLNLGKFNDACNALLPYNMAPVAGPDGKPLRDPQTGKVVKKFYPGLARRREAERHLCRGEAW